MCPAGLSSVRVQPEGLDFSTTGMTPGTTSEVMVDYEALCCTTYAEIISVDMQGNVGTCVIEMEELGGRVSYFFTTNIFFFFFSVVEALSIDQKYIICCAFC